MDLDLEDFFENGEMPIHAVGPDGRILRANAAELDLLGYTKEEYIGRHIREFHADEWVIDDILTRLCRGEKIAQYPARLRARDGSLKSVLITSSAAFRNGALSHTRCFTVDVTQATSSTHDYYRKLLDALPVAVYMTDPKGRITYANEAAVDLAGRRPLLGTDTWCVTWRLYRSDGSVLPHDQCPMAIALKEQRPVRGVQAVLERPDGTRAPFLPHPTPLFNATGQLIGGVNVLVDLSERNKAAKTEQLLINELHHRIKNTLANVQALARSTFRNSRAPEHFVESFSGRLQSLAEVHSLLTSQSWQSVLLRSLVHNQVSAVSGRVAALAIEGPELLIQPDMAMHLAMVLHELATNSHKYGSLSQPQGEVRVSWEVKQDVLHLRWREYGGPSIALPSKRGFGSSLIERCVAAYGGSARLNADAAGLSWLLELKLPENTTASGEASSIDAGDHSGKRIFIIEDEPLIALDLVDTIRELGHTPLGPAQNVSAALELVSSTRGDLALLDANLGGKSVEDVASALTRLRVPFAFVSGYGAESLPVGFQQAVLIRKPCSAEALSSFINSVEAQPPSVINIRDRR